jgi:hypothetical protein
MADVSEEMMDSIRMISSQLAVLKIDQATMSQSTSCPTAKDRCRTEVCENQM